MTRRQVSSPPELPGFDYVELIGSGGYADVFLYDQQSPSRRVAVKVLDPGAVPAGAVADYTAEANLMAKVSAHPYIVQVFLASVAPDGRPYLVMEYYPGRNFYDRARHEQLNTAEVLRVGVQIASAVETAHRAGVLHRDIKPANVLTSAYRHPGLTDFGIASVQGPASDTADGLSIPWSPPEAMGQAPADPRSDVYSLAATVYTLLAGRSPFEVKGGDNSPLALIARVERDPVPPIGRADIPQMLERVLARAMAKDPAHRPATAADFGRQLQAVESEMHLAVTTLELADDPATVRARVEPDDEDATRVKGVVEVHAQGPTTGPAISAVPAGPGVATGGSVPVAERRREGLLAEPEVEATVQRTTAPEQHDVPESVDDKGVPKVVLAAVGAAALLTVVIGLVVLRGGEDDPREADDERAADAAEVNDNIGLPDIEVVAALDGVTTQPKADGTFTFTWDDRGEGFSYAVVPDGGASVETDEATITVPSECVEVAVIAPDGTMSPFTASDGCLGAAG